MALEMGVGEWILGAALRGKTYGLLPPRPRRTKLTLAQADEIRRLRAEGLTERAIAA